MRIYSTVKCPLRKEAIRYGEITLYRLVITAIVVEKG